MNEQPCSFSAHDLLDSWGVSCCAQKDRLFIHQFWVYIDYNRVGGQKERKCYENIHQLFFKIETETVPRWAEDQDIF